MGRFLGCWGTVQVWGGGGRIPILFPNGFGSWLETSGFATSFLLHSLDAMRNYSNHRGPGSQAIFVKQTNHPKDVKSGGKSLFLDLFEPYNWNEGTKHIHQIVIQNRKSSTKA